MFELGEGKKERPGRGGRKKGAGVGRRGQGQRERELTSMGHVGTRSYMLRTLNMCNLIKTRTQNKPQPQFSNRDTERPRDIGRVAVGATGPQDDQVRALWLEKTVTGSLLISLWLSNSPLKSQWEETTVFKELMRSFRGFDCKWRAHLN